MKKLICCFTMPAFLLALVFVTAVFALAKGTAVADVPGWWIGSPGDYNRLAAEAAKEGQLILYDSLPDKAAKDIAQAFNKLYPEVQIVHYRVRGPEAKETILREFLAGVTKIDVLEGGVEEIPTFKEMNFFKKYDWQKKFKVHPIQVGTDGELVKVGGSLHVFVYNTDMVSHEEAPKTYEDLLDPKWKHRKIGMDTRPKGFSALWPGWGEEKMVDYLKKLGKHEILYKRGTTAGVQMTAAGEVSIYVTSTFDSYTRVKNKGAPINHILPKPMTGVTFERMSVLQNAPHPNAAVLYLGWLASGGQKVYDKVSSGEGIPLPGFDTAAGRLIKSIDQLSVFDDKWVPLRSGIRRKCSEALGFIPKKKKKK